MKIKSRIVTNEYNKVENNIKEQEFKGQALDEKILKKEKNNLKECEKVLTKINQARH